jgi:hypothetical protein
MLERQTGLAVGGDVGVIRGLANGGIVTIMVWCVTACGSGPDRSPSPETPTSPTHAAAPPEPYLHADPSGDVVAITGDEGEDEAHPAPHQRLIDIVRTRVVLTQGELRVEFRYRDLPDGSEDKYGSAFRAEVVVKTDAGLGRQFTVDWTKGFKDRTYTYRLHPYGELAKCGFGHTVDRGRDLVLIIVPRRCLQSPEWVRVQTDSVVWIGDPRDTIAWDDGLADGYRQDQQQWSRRIDTTG